jgi:hypothetical protein
LEELRKAAPLFHMTVVSLEARTEVDFDRVFAQMSSDRPDAVLTTSDPLHLAQMLAVIDFLLKNRIAGLFQSEKISSLAGLMPYACCACCVATNSRSNAPLWVTSDTFAASPRCPLLLR